MSPLAQMIQLVLLSSLALGAVYFVFYRPTVAARERQRRVIVGLREGDEIVTTSGFIATVVDITEPEDGPVELLLDLGGGNTVRALTSAIADRLPRPEEREHEDEAEPGDGAASTGTLASPEGAERGTIPLAAGASANGAGRD